MANLTPKQRRFVEEYLSNGENVVAAYRAVYSKAANEKTAWTNGARMLKSTRVAQVIHEAHQRAKKRTDKIMERYAITKENVLREFARIGFSDVTDIVSVKDGQVVVKDTDDVSDDARRAISEISESINESGDRTIKVKSHSKIAALTALAKHLGLDKSDPQDDDAIDDMANDQDPERIDRGEKTTEG
ncbi:terminase small subunit [Acetobacter oryzifermentans]|uniref:terminase small subunit n=1 Tax=Acetobacter oryzifermentans TaxID=1633874 RepID=UPI0039BFB898